MWYSPPIPSPKPQPHYVRPARQVPQPAVQRIAKPAPDHDHQRTAVRHANQQALARHASLRSATRFAYQGPLDGALRSIADHLGWQFSTVGRPTKLNVLVNPHPGETWFDVLRQLGNEAGKSALVSVNAKSQTITAIYRDAPAALRRQVYVPSGDGTARKALLSIASQAGLMFVDHYRGQHLRVRLPSSATSWSDLRSIAAQIRGHARIAINLQQHTLTITGAHHA